MSTRTTKKRPLQQVAIGDMRDRIELYQRDIKSPAFNSAKFTETYTLICKRWAMITTVIGQVGFGNVSTGTSATHRIYIRFLDGIGTETRIKWKGNYYEILKVTNPDERNDFLILESKILGDSDLKSNQ